MSDRDALAAQFFPAEWAKAITQTGKKAQNRRHILRRRAEYEAAMVPLRSAGQSCAGCVSFQSGPPGIGGKICAVESDHAGYVRAEVSGLCPHWRAR